MNRIDELVRASLDDHADEAPLAAPVVTRVLNRRARRRPGRLAVAAVAASTVAVVGIGIAVVGGGSDSTNRPASDPAFADNSEADVSRTAAIYSLTLERFLRDSFRGEESAQSEKTYRTEGRVPPAIQIVSRPEKDAGWADGKREFGDPLSPEDRAAIEAELSPLTEVEWIQKMPRIDPDDRPGDTPPVITLGLLPDGDGPADLSLSAIHGFANGWLTTYVVEAVDGEWKVTGTGVPSGVT